MKWPAALAAPFALLLLIPVVALVTATPISALGDALHRPETVAAMWVSLRTTACSLVILIIFGTPLAWVVGQSTSRVGGWLSALVELPAVLPPSVAGVALLIAFGHAGLIGKHLPFEIPFTATAVILAQLFVASPFFLRPSAEAFRGLDGDTLAAARLDGAGKAALARFIVWPSVRPAYIGALCLAWARALGEFGATLLFAGSFTGVTQTAPLAIYDAFETDLDAAKALGVLLLVLAALILAAAKLTLRPIK